MDVFWGFLAMIVLPVLSCLMIGKPEWLWKLDHMFTVKGGEPTEFYLTVMRLFGTLLLVCWVILLIWLVLNWFLG